MIVGILGLLISLYLMSMATRRRPGEPVDGPVVRDRDVLLGRARPTRGRSVLRLIRPR